MKLDSVYRTTTEIEMDYKDADEKFIVKFNCNESVFDRDIETQLIIKKYYLELIRRMSIIDIRINKESDQENKINLQFDKLSIAAALGILNSGISTGDLNMLIRAYKNALIRYPAK